MWLVGLVVGLILGNLSGTGTGVFIGGILGLIGGFVYSEHLRNRSKPFEQRLADLERLVS